MSEKLYQLSRQPQRPVHLKVSFLTNKWYNKFQICAWYLKLQKNRERILTGKTGYFAKPEIYQIFEDYNWRNIHELWKERR